jgi:hypothetical protein
MVPSAGKCPIANEAIENSITGVIEQIGPLGTIIPLVETEQLQALHKCGVDMRFDQSGQMASLGSE